MFIHLELLHFILEKLQLRFHFLNLEAHWVILFQQLLVLHLEMLHLDLIVSINLIELMNFSIFLKVGWVQELMQILHLCLQIFSEIWWLLLWVLDIVQKFRAGLYLQSLFFVCIFSEWTWVFVGMLIWVLGLLMSIHSWQRTKFFVALITSPI